MNSGWFLKRENVPVQAPTKYELVIASNVRCSPAPTR
jgi:hypothetical protein